MKILRNGIKNGSRVFCENCGRSHAVTSLTSEGDLTYSDARYRVKGHNDSSIYITENFWHIVYSKRVIRKRTGQIDCTGYVAYCGRCFNDVRINSYNLEEPDITIMLGDWINKFHSDETLVSIPSYMRQSTIERCLEFDRLNEPIEPLNNSNEEEEEEEEEEESPMQLYRVRHSYLLGSNNVYAAVDGEVSRDTRLHSTMTTISADTLCFANPARYYTRRNNNMHYAFARLANVVGALEFYIPFDYLEEADEVESIVDQLSGVSDACINSMTAESTEPEVVRIQNIWFHHAK